jgi:hypothetical protein
MKNTLVLILLVAVGLGVWWQLSRTFPATPGTSGIISPKEVFKARPILINKSLTVDARSQQTWSVPAPGPTPGLLQGRWNSSGASGGIRGAQDDTLVSFELRGPDNALLQRLDHPLTGNFSIRYETAGIYTFTFNNAGFVRSTARTVTIEGTYQPD